jgi:4-hydroxymandelate oxidase
VLSTLSNSPVEEVVAASAGPVLFQLYVYRDRGATKALVERVAAAGVAGIVLTADAPVLGTRERDVRNAFRLPPGLDMPNATAEPYRVLGEAEGDSALAAWVLKSLDPRLSWDDLAWLREVAGLPVVLKGLVRGDDAARAVDAGAAAVVVSNHGGRQLDGAVPTIRALPDVAEHVAGRVPVWLDGGVRRGTDVLRALALGASFVLVGRPALYGLAWDGADGVEAVLRMLHAELVEAMLLAGAGTLAAITSDLVLPPPRRA